ncbi:hypothetical protein PISL3812_05698 [Talaromyces islandicus]|uniref:Rhamnogalacturonase A/B/Epimerase-like pectate lyase domain-containing protein n=1 Tax=Talaromyces islandicus TaxID=28573 RepID=A0A0U1LZA8_TALIS|nr:hypothetical protein PISL3812_05698 [Talaromyces islandicus]
MYIEWSWVAFASTAGAALLPFPLPEPTQLFAPDRGFLDLPPKPISALAGAIFPFIFPHISHPTSKTTSTTTTKPPAVPPVTSAFPTPTPGTKGDTTNTPNLHATVGDSTAASVTSSNPGTSISSSNPGGNFCANPTPSQAPSKYWLETQDHTGSGRGKAPFIQGNTAYPVHRNVLDYGVKNDGSGKQTAALQDAINSDGQGGSREGRGVTYMPAEVFLPGGVYKLDSTLDLRLGTIIVGDPLNRPVIKASSDFVGSTLINGQDPAAGHPETTFMIALKDVILDTTDIDASAKFTALQWGIAQGCALTNVEINMPQGSLGHIGIHINGGSTIAVTDVTIRGGGIGIQNSNQQVNFKNISFNGCRTGFAGTGGFTVVLQGATFDSCGLGVDITKNSLGSMVILDSTSTNTGTLVKFHDSSKESGPRNSQLVIENHASNDGNPLAVTTNGTIVLGGQSHIDTWFFGNHIPGVFQAGGFLRTSRPRELLGSSGKYFTRQQPNYANAPASQVVNVKTVSGNPVQGDGKTDDSASLNAILRDNAANCRISYFPFGVYILKDTLVIPPGSRIMGEGWSVLSGAGSAFTDSANPRPVIKVGKKGDVGVAEIQYMRFTVAEPLPGAVIVEVNMAGNQPGDVGIWNSLTTVGGTADTTISSSCTNQDARNCMAAFMLMHLTSSSSAYIENHWGWTADHNLDGGPSPIIVSTGRGILVESTKPTWLVGTSSEHNWLYQYNFHSSSNVYAGMMQSETPYMQGLGAVQTAPAPWGVTSEYKDPDFSWCANTDQLCRSALATNVDAGSNIMLYGSAAWAFFEGRWNGLYDTPCANGVCQSNMMRVTNKPQNLVWYSISTKSSDVMVLDGSSNPREYNNPGGWSGLVQVYRQFAS